MVIAQGMGAGFIPGIVNTTQFEIMKVRDLQSIQLTPDACTCTPGNNVSEQFVNMDVIVGMISYIYDVYIYDWCILHMYDVVQESMFRHVVVSRCLPLSYTLPPSRQAVTHASIFEHLILICRPQQSVGVCLFDFHIVSRNEQLPFHQWTQ